MESSASKLGSTLGRYLGAAAIGALVRSSLLEFAKLDRSFTALRIQLDGLGQDSATNLPKVRATLEAISSSGGGLVSETLPAFRTFLGLTKNVNTALSLTQLVSNMAESGMGDLASATSVLAGVLSGQASRGLKDWGINVREAADGTVQADKAMALVYDAFPKRNAETQDAANQLNIFSDRWERFKLVIGEAAAATVNFYVDGLSTVYKFFRDLPDEVRLAGLMVVGTLKGLGPALAETFNVKRIMFGGPGGITAAFDAGFKEVQPQIDALREKIRAKDVDAAAESGKAQGEAEAKARADAIRVAGEKERQEQAAKEKKAAEDRVKDALALNAKRVAQEVDDWQTRMGLVKDFAEVEKKATEDRSATQAELYQMMLDRIEAVASAEEQAIQEELQGDNLTLAKREELEARLIAIDQARLLRQNHVEGAIQKIKERGANREYHLAKLTADQKLALDLQVAQAAIGFANAAFGDTKAGAIAEAIVSTLVAVTNALKLPPPYGEILAGIIAATGAANVHKIRTTYKGGASDLGGGGGGGGGHQGAAGARPAFDIPLYDQMAFLGGKKSIGDFIKLTQAGMRAGFREEATRPDSALPESSAGDVINITINGYADLTALRRALERTGRHDRSRLMR